jgi:hypothetical protein
MPFRAFVITMDKNCMNKHQYEQMPLETNATGNKCQKQLGTNAFGSKCLWKQMPNAMVNKCHYKQMPL